MNKQKQSKNQPPDNPAKKWYWLGVMMVDLFIVYFSPIEIFYYADDLITAVVAYSLVLFLSPYLLFKTLSAFYPRKVWTIVVAYGSVLFFGPTFALHQSAKEESALLEKGTWTTATIRDKYKTGRRQSVWTIFYEFSTNGNFLVKGNADVDHENLYAVGDSIDIVYLPHSPKINKVDFEME